MFGADAEHHTRGRVCSPERESMLHQSGSPAAARQPPEIRPPPDNQLSTPGRRSDGEGDITYVRMLPGTPRWLRPRRWSAGRVYKSSQPLAAVAFQRRRHHLSATNLSRCSPEWESLNNQLSAINYIRMLPGTSALSAQKSYQQSSLNHQRFLGALFLFDN
jgi:hypothetical protein